MFEHIPEHDLPAIGREMLRIAARFIFLSPIAHPDRSFVFPHDEKDPTHITRLTRDEWMSLFPYPTTEHPEVVDVSRGEGKSYGNICALVERYS